MQKQKNVDETNENVTGEDEVWEPDEDYWEPPVPGPCMNGSDIAGLLTDMSDSHHTPTLFRNAVIEQIMAVLISRDKPNAMLVGPAGSGKTNIVEELAHRIKEGHKSIPKNLREYRIYNLNLSDLVSGSGLVGDLERKVSALTEYLEDPQNGAILFLDEIHTLFSGDTSYKKVAQMLKPGLSRGKFKVIGATTTQEVKKVDQDPAFNRRFTRVLVDELTGEQTETILEHAIPVMQEHYGVRINNSPQIPKLIVKVADEFCCVGSHRPDNALTLLDRTIANRVVRSRRKTISLTRELVEETAYRMASGNSSMKKLNETALRKSLSNIRGQEKVIEDILQVIRLYDMHLRPRTKPLTFLFAGPSGVGKSEIARILAREYMCEKPIILNMTEYGSASSINRIIGAPSGYIGSDSTKELPFDQLETNPYQLILLDEFEKCDRSVQRLFMSVFDEGILKSNRGDIDFSKAIIIATTNAGCTHAAQNFGFQAARTEADLTVSELSECFDAELLGRFSHKYTFRPIDRETYRDIVRDAYIHEVEKLDGSRLGADARKQLRPIPDERLLEMLVSGSYQKSLGARPARTAVIEYIDNVLLGGSRGTVKAADLHAYALEKHAG